MPVGVLATPPPTVRDARGKVWPRLDIVRGACEDHLLPIGSWDGPMRWESQRKRPYVTASAANTLRGYSDAETCATCPNKLLLIGVGAAAAYVVVRWARRRRR